MTTDPLAQAVMVAHCGWDPTVLVTDETALLDGDGTRWAFLPSLNVTAVSAVVVTNPDGSTYTATIGPGDTDVGWADNGILTWQSGCNGGTWPTGQQSIAVTYSGGYNGPPENLGAALDHLSARMPRIGGAVSKKIGTASVTYAQQIAAGGLLLVEQLVFDQYRLPRAK